MKSLLRIPFLVAALAVVPLLRAAETPAQTNRWSITNDGGIEWKPKSGERHFDHIEMSGRKLSVIVFYGVDEKGALGINRQIVWPMLRFKPNTTRHHFLRTFGEDSLPRVVVVDRGRRAPNPDPDHQPLTDFLPTRFHHKGIITIEGTMNNRALHFTRTIFPSADKPAVIDHVVLTNRGNAPLVLQVDENERLARTNAEQGVYGGYVATSKVIGTGTRSLKPGESTSYSVIFSARKTDEPELTVDVAAEEKGRRERVAKLLDPIVLETPDRVLNTAFAFAKIRAGESIYETKGGLLHSPGGGHYYAAVWANDQAEYANPFFAMLGDATAVESAINSYRLFARYMNPDYKPIPSSIISEGADDWHGAGDRGDMAMIAYGASRFALAYGKKETAEELWPLIEWSLEYCKRKVNAEGVVESDADELENRFPAGKANLCTATLYYDALLSSAALARELGKPAQLAADYETRAKTLYTAIENYFGRTVEGFETYRYFDKAVPAVNARALERHRHYANEPDHLRAWICMPLTVGIYDRAEGTIDALFSPKLWTADGLATEAGKETFWDRSTLYALRGVFAAGETQRALDFLTYYSNRRLLGDHVPYPIEAWPENDQRHLSAESALYCRIYTEGVFGIRPTGFTTFEITPRLPKAWPAMALKNVHAFGSTFDLSVKRDGQKLRVEITRAGQPAITQTIDDGATTTVKL